MSLGHKVVMELIAKGKEINIIYALGGYEAGKQIIAEFKSFNVGFDAFEQHREDLKTLEKGLLDYRRRHNYFEKGDLVVLDDDFKDVKIVSVKEIIKDIYCDKTYTLSDGKKYVGGQFRHPTIKELQNGRRL